MDISRGHWIFAALFILVFIGVLFWSFRKDRQTIQTQFGNAGIGAIVVGLILILIIIIKFALRNLKG
jgi:hypothetical protein